jgi:hypothetical protein
MLLLLCLQVLLVALLLLLEQYPAFTCILALGLQLLLHTLQLRLQVLSHLLGKCQLYLCA